MRKLNGMLDEMYSHIADLAQEHKKYSQCTNHNEMTTEMTEFQILQKHTDDTPSSESATPKLPNQLRDSLHPYRVHVTNEIDSRHNRFETFDDRMTRLLGEYHKMKQHIEEMSIVINDLQEERTRHIDEIKRFRFSIECTKGMLGDLKKDIALKETREKQQAQIIVLLKTQIQKLQESQRNHPIQLSGEKKSGRSEEWQYELSDHDVIQNATTTASLEKEILDTIGQIHKDTADNAVLLNNVHIVHRLKEENRNLRERMNEMEVAGKAREYALQTQLDSVTADCQALQASVAATMEKSKLSSSDNCPLTLREESPVVSIGTCIDKTLEEDMKRIQTKCEETKQELRSVTDNDSSSTIASRDKDCHRRLQVLLQRASKLSAVIQRKAAVKDPKNKALMKGLKSLDNMVSHIEKNQNHDGNKTVEKIDLLT